MIYTDAYAVIAGGRHPLSAGLGKVLEGWPKSPTSIRRVMVTVLRGRKPVVPG